MVNVQMGADKGGDTGFPVLGKWPRLSKGIKMQGKKNPGIPSVSVSFLSSVPLFSTFLSLFLDLLPPYMSPETLLRALEPGLCEACASHCPESSLQNTRPCVLSAAHPLPHRCICLQSHAPKAGSEYLGRLRFLPGETHDLSSEATI